VVPITDRVLLPTGVSQSQSLLNLFALGWSPKLPVGSNDQAKRRALLVQACLEMAA